MSESEPPEKSFYVSVADETLGPFTSEEIARRLRAGELGADVQICAVGGSQWQPIEEVPELASAPVDDAAPDPEPMAEPAASGERASEPLPAFDLPEADDEAKTLLLDDKKKAELAARIAQKRKAAASPTASKWRERSQHIAARAREVLRRGIDLLGRLFRATVARARQLEIKGQAKSRRLFVIVGAAAIVLGILIVVSGLLLVKTLHTEKEPLWAPCLEAVLTEVEIELEGETKCGPGVVELTTNEQGITLVFHQLPEGKLAAKMPAHVSELFPNLGPPEVSKGKGCLGLVKRSDWAPAEGAALVEALSAYHAAVELTRRCARAGGLRAAEWPLEEGRMQARMAVNDQGALTRLRITVPPEAPLDASWKDVPWKPEPVHEPLHGPESRALAKSMEKDGWWPGDARAFVEAASKAGIEKGETLYSELGAVARWLRSSDSWTPATRATMYSECIRVKAELALKEDPRGAYEMMAGVSPDGARLLAEPASKKQPDWRELFAERFDAAIGSAVHAQCALTIGCPLTKADAYEPMLQKSLEAEGKQNVDRVRALVCHKDFPAHLRDALAGARRRLLDAGSKQAAGAEQAPAPAASAP